MSEKFIESHMFPLQLEYTSEYLDALHKYQSTRRLKQIDSIKKTSKEVVFRKVTREQIGFFRKLMKDPATRNQTLEQKQQLLQKQFQTQISRSTVYKIQR